jgi:hypothetical protein
MCLSLSHLQARAKALDSSSVKNADFKLGRG